MRTILTLNAGSSSLKFALFALAGVQPNRLLRGSVDGLSNAAMFRVEDADGLALADQRVGSGAVPIDADGALDLLLAWLFARFPKLDLMAIGHRVVHGGSAFAAPALLTDAAIRTLEGLVPLAPLHQPFNLKGVAVAREAFPNVPQIACFDTAFHAGQSFAETAFALPRSFYQDGVRRYGFHGLSYEYVSRRMASLAPAVAEGRMVVAHLGSGASLCAVRHGRSVASTMGFSALDGLVMGTRCGQLDPGVLLYLMDEKGMDAAALTRLLYRESGLKGLSGLSPDMRTLEASDDPRAVEAIDCFVARVRREVGAMTAAMGGIDGLVFTGGIGEHSARIRDAVTKSFDWLGIAIDGPQNRAGAVEISSLESRVRVFRVPTDEEAMIARHVVGLLAAAGDKVARVA